MKRAFFLFLFLIATTGCSLSGFNTGQEASVTGNEPPPADSHRVDRFAQHFAKAEAQEQGLELEDIRVDEDNSQITHLYLEFSGFHLIEVPEARSTIVKITEGMARRINNDDVMLHKFKPAPYPATRISVTLNFRHFFAEYNRVAFVERVTSDGNVIRYFNFDDKLLYKETYKKGHVIMRNQERVAADQANRLEASMQRRVIDLDEHLPIEVDPIATEDQSVLFRPMDDEGDLVEPLYLTPILNDAAYEKSSPHTVYDPLEHRAKTDENIKIFMEKGNDAGRRGPRTMEDDFSPFDMNYLNEEF